MHHDLPSSLGIPSDPNPAELEDLLTQRSEPAYEDGAAAFVPLLLLARSASDVRGCNHSIRYVCTRKT